MEEKVEEIGTKWDNWIENNGLESLSDRRKNIHTQIENLLTEIDADENLKDIKKLVLKAKLMTVYPEYSQEAKEMLEKVVKRDPSNFEAWNLLGEQYWRSGPSKLLQAKQCFEGSLNKKVNCRSLRSLSMILRALPESNSKTKWENIKLSFQKAKQAVDIDENNGQNWYVLGNAYLTLFVHSSGVMKQELIKKSYSSYERAEKLGQNFNPDLHYNRAQLLLFDEKWQETYDSLNMALQYDPEWDLPKQKLANILDFCIQVGRICENKGKLSTKKLAKLSQKIEKQNDILCIATLSHFDYLPFTFIGMDSTKKTMLVTVYNIERGRGPIIGDIINSSKFSDSQQVFALGEEKFNFISRRIDDVSEVKLNNKILSGNVKTNVQNLNML